MGKHSIRLPPGKYQVSGYELNSYLTDKKLAGKLESPQNEFQTGIFNVSATEWKKSRDYVSQRHLFDFSNRPEIKGAEFNLTTSDVPLVAGKYYVYSVEALDATGKAISTTANHFDRFDFYAVG